MESIPFLSISENRSISSSSKGLISMASGKKKEGRKNMWTTLGYIMDKLLEGKRFFKSDEIAREIEISPYKVGAHLSRLSGEIPFLRIKRWSRTGCFTWLIEPDLEKLRKKS